jgi:hypothetical protein
VGGDGIQTTDANDLSLCVRIGMSWDSVKKDLLRWVAGVSPGRT